MLAGRASVNFFPSLARWIEMQNCEGKLQASSSERKKKAENSNMCWNFLSDCIFYVNANANKYCNNFTANSSECARGSGRERRANKQHLSCVNQINSKLSSCVHRKTQHDESIINIVNFHAALPNLPASSFCWFKRAARSCSADQWAVEMNSKSHQRWQFAHFVWHYPAAIRRAEIAIKLMNDIVASKYRASSSSIPMIINV